MVWTKWTLRLNLWRGKVKMMKDETSKENLNPFNEISDDNTVLRFKKLSDNATTPMRGSRNAAGFDIYSAETKEIAAQSHGIVKTDKI